MAAVAPEVLVLRLGKEAPGKCSLTPLRRRAPPGFRWGRIAPGRELTVGPATLLHPDGEPLSAADAARPLLLVDSSWRDLPRALRGLRGELHLRRLPAGWSSAYPRSSKSGGDPAHGLASIEALHAALCLLGWRDDHLLDGYPWREEYLRRNAELLQACRPASRPL